MLMRGVGSKICGLLDELPSVTMGSSKSKILNEFEYDFNSALSASKDRPTGATRFYTSRSLRQGQRSNQGHTMMLYTYNP